MLDVRSRIAEFVRCMLLSRDCKYAMARRLTNVPFLSSIFTVYKHYFKQYIQVYLDMQVQSWVVSW